uniref:Nucleoside diphosphate kinase n=1 Tax=Maconellicoccus hirsutus TaxID=177089 RepID=A2I494_MACHI|nr:putative abnormal wing disc-like protein [Maconellicoccus hirsutus]
MVVCSLLYFLHFVSKYIMASPNCERTFIMVKPDGVQRGIVGKIIERFEAKGFKLVALKFTWASEELLQKHYSDLAGRPFFPGLVKYMSSGPVVPMVWEGLNVVKTGRVMLGATDPKDSAPGTIRGDFCIQVGRNIIHGSDSVDSANKEISLWFTPDEVVEYKRDHERWVYE